MAKGNDQLVLAIFESEQAANSAAEELKGWDKANDDIKLGAIGVITVDSEGKTKTRKHGPHNTGRGATIGVVVGVITAVLPPVGLVAGAATGLVVGGVIGSFSRKGLGMSDDDLQKLQAELQGGRAALAVLIPPEEVAATTAQLEKLGGTTRSHEVSQEDLKSANEAIQANPEVAATVAEAAAPETKAAAPEEAADTAPASTATSAPSA